jgi:hypothetical protein
MFVSMIGMPARLRIERRLDRRQHGSHLAQHVFEHVIAANAKFLSINLQPGMPVADVPGKSQQLARRSGGDFGQRLTGASHRHDRTIVEHQAIAVVQGRGARKVKQEPGAALADQHGAPAVAILGIKNDAVDRFACGPFARTLDQVTAFHAVKSLEQKIALRHR